MIINDYEICLVLIRIFTIRVVNELNNGWFVMLCYCLIFCIHIVTCNCASLKDCVLVLCLKLSDFYLPSLIFALCLLGLKELGFFF